MFGGHDARWRSMHAGSVPQRVDGRLVFERYPVGSAACVGLPAGHLRHIAGRTQHPCRMVGIPTVDHRPDVRRQFPQRRLLPQELIDDVPRPGIEHMQFSGFRPGDFAHPLAESEKQRSGGPQGGQRARLPAKTRGRSAGENELSPFEYRAQQCRVVLARLYVHGATVAFGLLVIVAPRTATEGPRGAETSRCGVRLIAVSAMKSVGPSGAPSFTPAQAHLRSCALIGTTCRSTTQAPRPRLRTRTLRIWRHTTPACRPVLDLARRNPTDHRRR